jgi:hypothetical protein
MEGTTPSGDIGTIVLIFFGLFILRFGLVGARDIFTSVAACPIHIRTTDTNGYPITDYCLHLGIGR